jgi:hypothetical protein
VTVAFDQAQKTLAFDKLDLAKLDCGNRDSGIRGCGKLQKSQLCLRVQLKPSLGIAKRRNTPIANSCFRWKLGGQNPSPGKRETRHARKTMHTCGHIPGSQPTGCKFNAWDDFCSRSTERDAV